MTIKLVCNMELDDSGATRCLETFDTLAGAMEHKNSTGHDDFSLIDSKFD